jgi:hypothetical protein
MTAVAAEGAQEVVRAAAQVLLQQEAWQEPGIELGQSGYRCWPQSEVFAAEWIH